MSRDTLAYALTGTNLRDVDTKVMPLDYVRAAGVAAKDHSLGLSLFRCKYSGQHKELKKAFECLCERYERVVVEQVLGHWLFDACPACDGRGHPVFEGTPVCDDDVDCEMCHGAGTLPPPKGWGQWHAKLWNEIGDMTYMAGAAVMQQLSDDIDS